ncbi:MAG: hypothetical protein H6568_03380 [Lewinellaceae bacterium]|nr:hypothetical protein [Lewinellaceae bacterium]
MPFLLAEEGMGSLIRRNPGGCLTREFRRGQEALPEQMWFRNEGVVVDCLGAARPCHDDKKDDLDHP